MGRIRHKEMKRTIFFIIILVVMSAYSLSKGDEIREETGAHREKDGICIRCHARIPAQKIMMKEDKRCIECHGPEDGMGDLVRTSNREIMPVSMEEKGHDDDMVLIPAGEFIMGSNGRSAAEGEGDLDERPTRKVYVDAFYIDRYEVTNSGYKRFVDTTGHRMPVKWKEGIYPPGKGDHPVAYVSWTDAYSYCRWVGKRLPSEEEWEKAARGTDGRHFPWGNEFDHMKANTPQYWLNIGKAGGTMPVGSFKEGRSPYGLYDMSGNVYEWTENWYKPYPGNRSPNVHYGEKNKVMRGGSWYDCLSYGCGLSSPAYNRTRFTPEIRNNNTGFRCAKDQ
ncbi:MAG TPA: formylglycine-generating enzyme family protein [Nitrospiria bacterium]|nr:formylglycine-generating enzyme family protein [Nitrospiria bacterium]